VAYMQGVICICEHLKQTFGCTSLLQVNIQVPRRPVVRHDYLGPRRTNFAGRPVAVLLCRSHVSLANMQVVCPRSAESTLGIMWVPVQMVQGTDGPVRPVFSATLCTIEGFQASD
jgi:hypothetical protein